MKCEIELFCGDIERMVYDDEERVDDNGFDFKQHSRKASIVGLSDSEQALSSAYIVALEKSKAYYVDLIVEREKLLKEITKRMLKLDAEHTEHRQKYREKIREEAEMLDGIMEILIDYSLC